MADTETIDLACSACGATLTVAARLKTAHCAYCDSPSIVERPARADRPDPTFVVGFVLDKEKAAKRVKGWLKSRWFARESFRAGAVDKVRGVYLPAYLYAAVAEVDYRADIGENYTVTETYTTTDANGKTVTRTRTKTVTEWRPLSGDYARYVLDVVVSASRGIPNDWLEAIEPFDLRALRRFTPAMLAGWIAEEPSLELQQSMEMARDEAMPLIGRRLDRFMPGDKHRNLQYRSTFRDEVADLVLLPIWVFAVRYDPSQKPIQVLVNGQTGKVTGRVARSWAKILLLILAILAAILIPLGAAGVIAAATGH